MSIHTRYRHIYTYSIDSEALDCWQQLIAVFYVLLESEVFLEFLSITLLRPPFLLLPYIQYFILPFYPSVSSSSSRKRAIELLLPLPAAAAAASQERESEFHSIRIPQHSTSSLGREKGTALYRILVAYMLILRDV